MDVGLCQYDDYLLVVGSKSSGVVIGSSIDYGNPTDMMTYCWILLGYPTSETKRGCSER